MFRQVLFLLAALFFSSQVCATDEPYRGPYAMFFEADAKSPYRYCGDPGSIAVKHMDPWSFPSAMEFGQGMIGKSMGFPCNLACTDGDRFPKSYQQKSLCQGVVTGFSISGPSGANQPFCQTNSKLYPKAPQCEKLLEDYRARTEVIDYP